MAAPLSEILVTPLDSFQNLSYNIICDILSAVKCLAAEILPG